MLFTVRVSFFYIYFITKTTFQWTVSPRDLRDLIEKVVERKKAIRDVGHMNMGYGNAVKFYVNANLCPAYKNLAYNYRLKEKR